MIRKPMGARAVTVCQHCGKGAPLISQALGLCLDCIRDDFSRPGKPTDNAFIESFNSLFGQECLNESWFLSLEDAREKVETWRQHYNTERPHGALGNLAPVEFVDAMGIS